MKLRSNPWPTPERKVDELHLAVKAPVSGDRLWQSLCDDEQRRLGGDFESAFRKYRGTVGIYVKLRGVSPRRAVLELARNFDLVSPAEYTTLCTRLGETGDELEARIKHAVCGHRLVVVEARRTIYFCGAPIDLACHAQEWTLMRLLIKKAPSKRLVSPEEVSAKTEDLSYLSKLVSRMANRSGFPPELEDLLVSPNRDGRLRLELDASEICVISDN